MNPAREAFSSASSSQGSNFIIDWEKKMANRTPYFSQLGIILTNRCNIQCAHCIGNYSPATHGLFEFWFLEDIIRQAAVSERLKVIGITGGEPFLEPAHLQRISVLCENFKLKMAVTTNGYWAKSPAAAIKTLKKIWPLYAISVSTDKFHQKFVPVANVINLIKACSDLSLKCFVRVSFLNNPDHEIDEIKQQLKEVAGQFELQSQPVTPVGRAFTDIPAKEIFSYNTACVPCESADHPAININGDVFACCGPPVNWPVIKLLHLGNLHKNTLAEIMDKADHNPLLHAIRMWGPGELLKLVGQYSKEKGLSLPIPAPDSFQEVCSICKFFEDEPVYASLLDNLLKDKTVYHQIATARLIELAEIQSFD